MAPKKITPSNLSGFGSKDKKPIREIRNRGLPGDGSTNAPFKQPNFKPGKPGHGDKNSGLAGDGTTDAPLNLGNIETSSLGDRTEIKVNVQNIICPDCSESFSKPNAQAIYPLIRFDKNTPQTVVCPHCGGIFQI
ncbi:MAG: hypothetical protein ISR58_13920 [Anaerolineales bacterium]|nr:hypothetical protein [Chloroflexota bacterium]MBL6982275.1 hypothetical protein [Anaerolineales bacterium]